MDLVCLYVHRPHMNWHSFKNNWPASHFFAEIFVNIGYMCLQMISNTTICTGNGSPMLRIRKGVFNLLAIAAVVTSNLSVHAQGTEKEHGPALYEAADLLVRYFSKDFEQLTAKTKKTAVVNFSISENLPGSLRNYLVKKFEAAAKEYKSGPLVLMQCVECLSLQAVTKGDEVFISKGITDKKQLEGIMKKLGIRNYIDANLTYTGSDLVFQASLVEANGQVTWSGEYNAHYRKEDSSPWVLGVTGQGVFFMKDKFPTPKAIRLFVGQKVYGVGNLGVAGTFYEKTDELNSEITELTGFFELNHNEFFSSYWKHMTLLYTADLGVADFNSFLQLAVELGVRLRFGSMFHIKLSGKGFAHVSKPDSDKDVYNPNGPSIIKTNENLPAAVIFGVGVDIL